LPSCPEQESFQKALRSLETGCDGWSLPRKWKRLNASEVVYRLRVPNPERVLVIKQVLSGARCLPHVCLCNGGPSLHVVAMTYAGWTSTTWCAHCEQGFEDGLTQADIREYTQMDPWFIEQLWELHQVGHHPWITLYFWSKSM
jgi:hypothetical protein